MAAKQKSKAALGWWAIINSPIVLAILTGLVFATGTMLYTSHREDAKEQAVRRSRLLDLLVEYRQRLSALEALDRQLNPTLGNKPGKIEIPRKAPLSETQRQKFSELSANIGKRQRDVIRGTGDYMPSAPTYANVNMQTIAAQIEDSAGIPNLQAGGIQMLGLLDWDPDLLWINVRALLPSMQEFYIGRHMLATNGQLPLRSGAMLTPLQERRLGIPDVKPGDLEKAMADNDRLSRELERKLTEKAEELE